jgi:ribonuclease HII
MPHTSGYYEYVSRASDRTVLLAVHDPIPRLLALPHECVPRADATHPEVSAASILAKTTRDAQVLALCDADPTLDARYAIRQNKGYLSAARLLRLPRLPRLLLPQTPPTPPPRWQLW